MLVDMRKKASSWMGWVIIAFLVLGFSFYGITSYLTGGTNPTVAKLGSVELKYSDYTRILEQEQQSQRQRFGEGIDHYLASGEFKESVARNYVVSRFFSKYVNEDLNMLGSDNEVAQYIRSDPGFQMDGQFDIERYKDSLQRRGTSVSNYEDSVRRQIAMSQIQGGIGQGDFVADKAIKEDWAVLGEVRAGRYVVFDNQSYLHDTKLTDAEYKAYYEENINEYQVPAGFRIAYVRVGPDDIRQQLAITDGDIEKYYTDNKAQFTTPALRSASHILIAINSERDDAAAKARADEVEQKLAAGEDFAELAKQYSDDPGSAENGGSLGPIEPGLMVESFEDAANALTEVGAISAPVKSDFGYHVIKIDGIEPERVETLAEVKESIRTLLEDEEIQRRTAELQTEMANVAYEQSDTLVPVSELAGIDIVESQWSSGNEVDSVFDNAPIRSELENAEVTNDGYNSGVIELESGAMVVFRVIEARDAAPLPYEEVKTSVVATALRHAAGKKAEEEGLAFIEAIKNEGFEKAELTVKRSFSDISSTKDAEVMNPTSGEAVALLFNTENINDGFGGSDEAGNYVVTVLDSIEPGSIPVEGDESYERYQELKESRNVYYNVSMLQNYVEYVVAQNGGVSIDLTRVESN